MADRKPKNRRYRNAKISEYKLRRVVECFARDMTAKDTAAATKLTPQAVDAIFMRLRERMFTNGLVKFDLPEGEPSAAQVIFDKKHRGVPDKSHPYYTVEFVHRVLKAQRLTGFEELDAGNPEHVKKATRLHAARRNGFRQYVVLERLKPTPEKPDGETVPFSPLDYREDSTILINERALDAHDNFFRYLWGLLLRHPL
jgi:hypothetical protein